MIDWGEGHYEQTARELEPVARHVVAIAAPRPGERVIDLGTGTGNAALLVAQGGAQAVGIDAAPRLVAVARSRAAVGDLDVEFVVGDFEALPFADGSFDVALSVFALIFAADPDRAMSELLRVLTPAGRAVMSVWIPAGPIDAMVGVFGRAVAEAAGRKPPERFAWHDSARVQVLAGHHKATATFHEGELTVEAESPEAYLASGRQHPLSRAALPLLARAGTAEAVQARALQILRDGNLDPAAFSVTSPYRVIELRRTGSYT